MFYIDLDLDLYSPGGDGFLRDVVSLSNISKTDRLLEVGASSGYCSRFLARTYGCTTVASDINPAWVPVIEAKAKKDGVGKLLTARREDVLSLTFKRLSFDSVLANGVLYFTDKEKALRELKRVTTKEGRIIIAEPIWLKNPPFRLRRALEWEGQALIETRERYDEIFKELNLTVKAEKSYGLPIFENYYQPALDKISLWKEIGSPYYTKHTAEIDNLLEEIGVVREYGEGIISYALMVLVKG